MEHELEQSKRKKGHHSVTPDIEVDQSALSDGYQSDGEASDISTRANEIIDQVLSDDDGKAVVIYSCDTILWAC